MTKFSIIVPVYNTEAYLNRCIDSILKQTYDNYEIIIVDDSTDNSKKIINEYVKKYPKLIKKITKKSHSGLADARNKGISKVTGDYILFVDSDDYIESGLLKTLSTKVKESPDIIRFQLKEIYNNKVVMFRELPFETVKGDTALKKIINYHYVEKVWCYAYRTEFYKENKFMFEKGTHHDDFGLLPMIILEASKVKSIGYVGYDRVMYDNKRKNYSYDEIKSRVDDYINHYNKIMKFIESNNFKYYDIFSDYFANCLIIKLLELNYSDYKLYLKDLKDKKIFNNLLTNTWKQKIRKYWLKISPRLYYKIVRH